MSKFSYSSMSQIWAFPASLSSSSHCPKCFSFNSPIQLCCICLGRGPADTGSHLLRLGQGLTLSSVHSFPSVLSLAVFLLLITAGNEQGFTCSSGSAAKWLQATFILTTKDVISPFGCLKATQTLTAAAEFHSRCCNTKREGPRTLVHM